VQVERRVLGNAVSLGVGAILGQFANFGFVILVARGFGREVFAQYALYMVIGGFACLPVSFGSISLLTRCSAQDLPASIEMLKSVLPIQLGIAILVWILVVAAALLFSPTVESLVILGCIVAHHIILRITSVLLALLQGQERMQTVAAVKVGQSVAMLGAGAALAFMTGNAMAGISAMPLTAMLFLLYTHDKLKGVIGAVDWRWDPRGAWDVAKLSFPLFLIIVVTVACDRLGTLMLGAIQSPDALATYASGERIITAAAILYTMLTAASVPAASRFALSERERFTSLANRITRIVCLATLPLSTVLFLFSNDIIVFMFGGEFATSAPVLRIVAWILVVRGINSVQAMAAVAASRQRDLLLARGVALAIIASLGSIVIWKFGATGLAWLMLVAETAYSAVLHLRLRRVGISLSPLRPASATLVACAVALAAGILSQDMSLPARIAVAAPIMLAGLWIFGAVRSHDLRYLQAILKTQRSDHQEPG
jgi:O-antigen/teichoic acid export membrane protein